MSGGRPPRIMNSVLITGGSGALGHALVDRLLNQDNPPERIAVYSRGEFRQFEMMQKFEGADRSQSLRFFIGDVRDRDRLRRAMEGIEVVIHAAALKRIEVGNYNPTEMVKTNVDGAVNVVEAAMDAGVKKVLGVSSDKAFEPVSPYGLSKAMAESIFLAANNIRGNDGPVFSVCRYGNVAGSTGSVIPLWRNILKLSDTVPVTDPDATRFWMFMSEAVDLVLGTIEKMKGGELEIPTLPAYRLGDLAEAMGAKMDVRGMPSYEKKHEGMERYNLSNFAQRLTIPEIQERLKQI